MKKRRLWISGIVLLTVFSMLFSQWGFAFAQDDPPDGSTASTSETDPSQTLDSGGEGGAAADGGINPIAGDTFHIAFYADSRCETLYEGETDRYVPKNGVVTLPKKEPTMPGREFVGWAVQGSSEVIKNSFNAQKDMKLYPKFVGAYTVNFAGTSTTYSIPEGQTVKEAGKEIPGLTPKTGLYPGGWGTSAFSSNQGDTLYVYGSPENLKITENTTFNAYYYRKVTLQYNGLPGASNEIYSVQEGSSLPIDSPVWTEDTTKPSNAEGAAIKNVHKFEGWYKNSTGSGSPVVSSGGGSFKPEERDVNLIAKWTVPGSEGFTVTFKTKGNSGSTADDITFTGVSKDAVISSFPDVKEAGVESAEWYTGPNGTGIKWIRFTGSNISDATKVKSSVTLYPKYTSKKLTVTFEASGNTTNSEQVGTQSVTYGNPAEKPKSGDTIYDKVETPITIPVCINGKTINVKYDFTGEWALKSTLKPWEPSQDPWDFSTPIEDNITLVALYALDRSSCEGECNPDELPSPDGFCTVTFKLGNGAQDQEQVIRKGDRASPISDPKKPSSTFGGWSLTDGGKTAVDISTYVVNEDTTFYAIWLDDIDVIFETAGGDYIAVKTIPNNSAVSRPPDPEKEGYTFKGWSETEQKAQDISSFVAYDFKTILSIEDYPKGEKVLYAWYYSSTLVNYHYNFGAKEKVVTIDIQPGRPLVMPDHDPDIKDMPAGQAFIGWFTQPIGGEQKIPGTATPLTKNTTLDVYAHWDAGFTVTYVPPAGSSLANKEMRYLKTSDDTITPPEFGSWKSGGKVYYIPVDGWYQEAAFTNKADFAKIKENGVKVSVFGKAEEATGKVKAIFHTIEGSKFSNGNNVIEVEVDIGKSIPEDVIPEPTAPGGSLKWGSWYLDEGYKDLANFAQGITKETHFYLRWIYVVTFKPGKQEVNPTNKEFEEYVQANWSVPEPSVPRASKYYFAGWSEDENATSEDAMWDFDNDKITKPTTLHGIWSMMVTFDPDEGNYFGPPQIKVYEKQTTKTVQEPEAPTKDGHIFIGWFTKSGEKFDFSTEITQNMTLYAKYEVDTTPETYQLTVSIEEGGKLRTPVKTAYEAGEKVELDLEVLPGYTFKEWSGPAGSVFSDVKSAKTTFTMPNNHVMVIAHIDEDAVVKTYSLEVSTETGGQYVKGNGSYEAGTKVPIEVRALDGYEFTGWVGPQSGKFANASSMATTYTISDANTVIIAKFKAKDATKEKTYQLTVNTNGGGSIVGKPGGKYEAGEKILLEAAAKSGYHFVNWTCDKSQGLGSFTNPNSNPTVFIMPQGHAVVTANFAKDPEPEPEPKPEPDPEPDNGSKWFPSSTSGGSGGGGGGGRGSGSASSSSRILKDKGNGSILNQSTTGTGNSSNSNGSAAPAAAYNVEKEAKGRVSAAKMDEMIEKNQEKDIRINNGNVVFTFEKGTMQPVEGVTWFDFNAEFNVSEAESTINSLAGDSKVLIVHYTHEGQLPAAADIQIQVGKEYAGNTLYYYYYNPQTKALEFVQSTVVSADGWLTVTQTHFSDYVLTSKDLYGDAAKASTAKASSTKEKTRVKLNNMTGSVTANAGAQASQGQTLSATASSGRTLPNAGQKSPAMLIVFGAAALAVSAASLRKFKKMLAESDEESETDE